MVSSFCKISYYINKEHIHRNIDYTLYTLEPPQTKTETTHKKTHKKATPILACVRVLSSLQAHTDFIWIKVGYWPGLGSAAT